MTELPPFLRPCRMLQSRVPHFRPDDDSTWKEAQVVCTSGETLLATTNEDAPELLVDFLLRLRQEDDRDVDFHNIIWLSSHTFVCNDMQLVFHERLAGRVNLLFCLFVDIPHETDFYYGTLAFYRLVGAPVVPHVHEVGTMLRLVAKHKTVEAIKFSLMFETFPATEFPVSLHDLKAFLSEANSPRTISFDVPLSTDHWRAIVSHCHKNVNLDFGSVQQQQDWRRPSSNWLEGAAPIIDALKNNTCPSKMWLRCLDQISQAAFHAVVHALETNTSLEELTLSDLPRDHTERRVRLLEAISRKSGLQMLHIFLEDTSDSEWEVLWKSVLVASSSHSTLKTVKIRPHHRHFTSLARDEILLQSVRSNTVLCELDCNLAVHNPQRIEEQTRPFLECNRFRPIVKAIKHEPNRKRRELWFSAMLLSYRVGQCAAFRFLLLKENSDLCLDFLSLPELPSPAQRRRTSSPDSSNNVNHQSC